MTITDVRRYLTPEVVARLGRFDLIARLVVEGFIAGLHRSPYHGFSVEFAEHRQYMPGDPVKDIDWKIYAKSDRLYVKEYEEETNLKAYLLIDSSRSMAFGSQEMTKFLYIRCLAAALSYLMLRQRDAVGMVLFDTAKSTIRSATGTRRTNRWKASRSSIPRTGETSEV